MRAITVGRSCTGRMLPSRACPYRPQLYFLAIKTYELRQRVRDGVLTWRFLEEEGTRWGRSPSPKMIREAKASAGKAGIEFIPYLTHGSPHGLSLLELLALAHGQGDPK